MELHAVLERPSVERLRDDLRSAVDADHLRLYAHRDEQVQYGDRAVACQRRIELGKKALAGEAVDDAEHAEAARCSASESETKFMPTTGWAASATQDQALITTPAACAAAAAQANRSPSEHQLVVHRQPLRRSMTCGLR